MIARRYFVAGRVQGVGFRWFVVRLASRLRITGWTRNLSDGRVEVLAQGEEGSLDDLAAALRAGPPGSRVESVTFQEEPVDGRYASFEVTA